MRGFCDLHVPPKFLEDLLWERLRSVPQDESAAFTISREDECGKPDAVVRVLPVCDLPDDSLVVGKAGKHILRVCEDADAFPSDPLARLYHHTDGARRAYVVVEAGTPRTRESIAASHKGNVFARLALSREELRALMRDFLHELNHDHCFVRFNSDPYSSTNSILVGCDGERFMAIASMGGDVAKRMSDAWCIPLLRKKYQAETILCDDIPSHLRDRLTWVVVDRAAQPLQDRIMSFLRRHGRIPDTGHPLRKEMQSLIREHVDSKGTSDGLNFLLDDPTILAPACRESLIRWIKDTRRNRRR